MKYEEAVKKWNAVIEDVLALEKGMSETLEEEDTLTKPEHHDLGIIRKGIHEVFRVLHGYFD